MSLNNNHLQNTTEADKLSASVAFAFMRFFPFSDYIKLLNTSLYNLEGYCLSSTQIINTFDGYFCCSSRDILLVTSFCYFDILSKF